MPLDLGGLINRMLGKPVGWLSMVARDSVCSYCNKSLEPEQRTVDHVVPISAIGNITENNLAMACQPCNAKKANHSLLEFLITSGGIHEGKG